MRHFALYFGIAAALVASCTIQEENIEIRLQEDVVFYASLEQPGEETRVYANEDLLLRWTADDRVSIFNQNTYNQQYKFTGATGDVEGGFSKVDGADFVTGNSIAHVVAVYPFQEATKISNSEALTVTLPSTQNYAENTFGLGANTMVSVTADNNLKFKNVCGFLRLNLYGEGISVSSITLKGNNGEKLAGAATVTMPLGGVPTVEMANDATTEITLVCDTPVELGATAAESKAFWFVVPPVTFSKGFTVSVSETYGGVFEKSTSKNLTITRSNVSKMAAIEVEPVDAPYAVPEMVDLGLPSGIKWASFNLGASVPEEYGDYFAWGETEPYYKPGFAQSSSPVWKEGKEGYVWSSYKWSEGGAYLTKYCNDPEIGYDGFTDQKIILDPEDDAAAVHLGGLWRIPTSSELKELALQCTWEWVSVNGINGRKVTGPNGNSIFFPAAGYRGGRYGSTLSGVGSNGHYWLSLYEPISAQTAWTLYFNESKDRTRYSESRRFGMTIRPVYGELVSVESVSLNSTSLTLQVGDSETLTATITPSNASEQSLTWYSDSYSIASVSEIGVVTAKSVGTAIITARTTDGGFEAECVVTVKEATPEAVDLGLPSGIKWGSFNLGATTPEERGDYYAWGELEPKTDYGWSTYKWCEGSETTLTKYNSYSSSGTVDNIRMLNLEDDVARVSLGDNWRLATLDEWNELLENCDWEWTTSNGTKGYVLTGSNGNSIFLPITGYMEGTTQKANTTTGYYWSSVLSVESSVHARRLHFNTGRTMGRAGRYFGMIVRPVYGELVPTSGVSLTYSSLNLIEGETVSLTATVTPSNASEKSVTWISSNPAVATVDDSGNVTAVAAGTATITVTTADGGHTADCSVIVLTSAMNDLSATATANSYIVAEAGYYGFKTVKGNTLESVGSVASAEVLWESFGTAVAPSVGDLVSKVSFRDGYISFVASDKKGNALIAAKDASGKILWSWHIWMTDQPVDQVYKNNAGTMMDRNLGATSTTPGDVRAVGLLYQWGRKDPFLSGKDIASSESAASTLDSWVYTPTSDVLENNIALYYSIAHPTTFLTNGVSPWNWYCTNNDYQDKQLWSETKTVYDPCPPGYRIPTGGPDGVWTKAAKSSSMPSWDNTLKGCEFGGVFTTSDSCWYPAAGQITYDTRAIWTGAGGYYWSHTFTSETYISELLLESHRVTSTLNTKYRSSGRSVRCQKE